MVEIQHGLVFGVDPQWCHRLGWLSVWFLTDSDGRCVMWSFGDEMMRWWDDYDEWDHLILFWLMTWFDDWWWWWWWWWMRWWWDIRCECQHDDDFTDIFMIDTGVVIIGLRGFDVRWWQMWRLFIWWCWHLNDFLIWMNTLALLTWHTYTQQYWWNDDDDDDEDDDDDLDDGWHLTCDEMMMMNDDRDDLREMKVV